MSSEQVAPSSSSPTLCVAGCGFFGNPRQENLCSKCYKQQQQQSATKVDESKNSSSLSSLAASQVPSASILAITSPNGSVQTLSNPTAMSTSSTDNSPIATSTFPSSTITLAPISNSPLLTPAALPLNAHNMTQSSPSASPNLLGVAGPNSTQSSPSLSPSGSPNSSPSLSPNKAPKKRCTICKKKVGMDFFNCKCDAEALFCSAHRLPHNHNCTYDHKKDQKAKVEKQNPIVKNAQFEKI
jgi:hypothetical protein